MEGECYDYDADIDELFVLAGKIICPAGQEEVHVCFTFKAPIALLLKFERMLYDMLTTCMCLLYLLYCSSFLQMKE